MSHPFLSEAWFEAVEELTSEQPEAPAALSDATINITVTGGPDGDVEVHLAGGTFERGHTEGAPTTLTVPYDVAKKVFIEGEPSAAMPAFMSGQIKIEGDMTKVLALQTVTPSAEQQAFQAKLAELTA